MSDFLFFGMCCMDILVYVREYPREDTDQRAIFQKWARGGNASNNCTVFSLLLRNNAVRKQIDQIYENKFVNPQIHYLGALGGDFWSKYLKEDFIQYGINIDAIEEYTECSSPMANCIVNVENGTRSILSFTKDLPDMTSQAIKWFPVDKLKWAHFEGRNIDTVLEMIRHIRSMDENHRIIISVDLEKPKPNVEQLLLEDIDLYIVEKEFGKIFGITTPEQMMTEMPLKIVNKNALLAFPWGSQGAFGVDKRSAQRFSSKSYPCENNFVDTLGAGDSFTAAIIFAIGILEYDLEKSLDFACRVAGDKCSAAGFDHLQYSSKLID